MASKKNKWIAGALALAITAGIGSLTACKKEETKEEVKAPDQIALANFESYEEGFQMLRFVRGFGKVTANEDTAYVSEGKRSAKLQPQGEMAATRAPTIYFPFKSISLNYDYTNLKKTTAITFDIYNASKEEKTVETGYVTGHNLMAEITPTLVTKHTLKTGWNSFRTDVDHEFLSLFMDVENVEGFFFRFEAGYKPTIAECDVFYLDNLQMHTCTEVSVPERTPTPSIADFENTYNEYMFTSEWNLSFDTVSVTDGVSPSQGYRMLQVKNLDVKGNGTWSYFVLNGNAIQNALKTVKEDKKAYIEFDIYDASADPMTAGMSVDFYLASGTKLASGFGFQPKNGKWVTVSIPVSSILKYDSEYLGKAGKANIWFKCDKEFTLYFDNFRVVEK